MKTEVMRALCLAAFVPIVAMFGCHQADSTATVQQAIGNTDGAVNVATGTTPASEVSACWTPAVGLNRDVVCAGYNGSNGNIMGWSWSIDQGRNWTPCSASNPAGCNGAGGLDAGGPTGGGAWGFRGDPTVVADKLGNVVYVNMSDDSGSPCSGACAKRIVAAVSNDGGRTFAPNTTWVNDGNGCGGGDQDQPDATFDLTTSPPTLWVTWRHRGGSSQTYGACLRRGYVSGSSIVWMGNAESVDGMGTEVAFWGIGAVRIRAGDGAVSIVYGNTDSLNACPTTTTNAFAMESVTSFNNGVDWVDRARLFHTGSWASCVLPKPPASPGTVDMGRNARNFDFARAPDGSYYVVAQESPENIRLFFNRTLGTHPSVGPGEGWREWCPNTPTGGAGARSTTGRRRAWSARPERSRPRRRQYRWLGRRSRSTIAAEWRSGTTKHDPTTSRSTSDTGRMPPRGIPTPASPRYSSALTSRLATAAAGSARSATTRR